MQRRWPDEIGGYDAEAVERFKATHGGLIRAQFAIALMQAQDQERIAEKHPELVAWLRGK